LRLFLVSALLRITLGSHWESTFAATCGIRAHSHRLAKPLRNSSVATCGIRAQLFVVFALIRIALGSHWESTFAATCGRSFSSLGEAIEKFFCCYLWYSRQAICGIRAHSHRLGKPLGSHCYCNLWHSCLFASHWEEAVGKLLKVFGLIGTALRNHWGAIFVAIHGIHVHLHRLGELLGNHFYCCLRCSRLFASPWEAAGEHCCYYLQYSRSSTSPCEDIGQPLLVLFVVSALIRVAFPSHLEALVAAICGIRVHLGSHAGASFADGCGVRAR
jgi:hypothetical protein